jgi:predicted MFS family arabinose efflux permease
MSSTNQPRSKPVSKEVNATILLLSMAAFSSSASIRVLDPALPRLAQDFNMAIPAVAHIVSLFAVVYGFLQLIYGPMADRYGKLRVMAIACSIGALGSIASALSMQFDFLLLARILTAVAVAGIIPLAMAWIGDAVPYAERQPLIARFLLGQIVGLASGSALGGIAADYFSWRMPFWALTVCFGVVAALLARKMGSEPRRSVASQGNVLQQLLGVVQYPWARRVLLTVFLEGLVLFGPFTFFATHLHLKLGLSLSVSGLLVMLFAGGGLVFAVNSKALVQRLGEVGLILWGSLLAAAGLILLAFTPIVALAPPALLMAGVGFYMLHNTLQTNATQMAPAARGSAVSLFAACFYLGQSAGVALGSIGVERWAAYGYGTTPVIALGSLLLVVVGTSFAWLRKRRA